MKSTNGGSIWINLYPSGYSSGNTFQCWYPLSENISFLSGGIIIRKTTDFGNTWSNYEIQGDIHGLSFIDSLRGWAVGGYHSIYNTTNGG